VIEIESRAPDPKVPYENLMPVLRALVAHGNRVVGTGFRLDPSGWGCLLADPIDFDYLDSRFTVPPTIEFSRKYDTVFDRLSWCGIEGPGAAEYQNVAAD
jgi:hypothetical protein